MIDSIPERERERDRPMLYDAHVFDDLLSYLLSFLVVCVYINNLSFCSIRNQSSVEKIENKEVNDILYERERERLLAYSYPSKYVS